MKVQGSPEELSTGDFLRVLKHITPATNFGSILFLVQHFKCIYLEKKRFLLFTIKFSENAGYAVISVVDFQNFPGEHAPGPPQDAPISPPTSILSPPTMPHLGEP